MKKILCTLASSLLIGATAFAQAPQGFNYQAVIRDASNIILNNQAVGVELKIHQGTPAGSVAYAETFSITTNANGLVNLEIGAGTVAAGDFTTIDWANGPYFVETSVDVTGGTSYVSMGTSQLLSVPYALHAANGPLAYGTVTFDASTIHQSYGVTSATNTGTGEYEIIIDHDWAGTRPVVIATSYNGSADTELITYSTSGTNTINIHIVDDNNAATDSMFSFIVYGVRQ